MKVTNTLTLSIEASKFLEDLKKENGFSKSHYINELILNEMKKHNANKKTKRYAESTK
ncbi:MAG: hypothetical protein ACOCV1_04635 [Bacillota bacterium]